MTMTPPANVERERLHWILRLDGNRHILDLLPSLIGSVAVEVDGRQVARLPKPTPQTPWEECLVEIAGETVVVALISSFVMQTDVFVGGRSLIDGRTLDAARLMAPERVRGYQLWARQFATERWRPTRDEVAYMLALAAVFGLVVFAWFAVRGGLTAEHAVVGGTFTAVWVAMMLIGIHLWFGAAGWVVTRLLARPDLGDVRRSAVTVGVLFGPPVGVVLAILLAVGLLR